MHDTRAFLAALDRSGYRLTAPRRVVAELVGRRDGHFTAADLVASDPVRARGIGRATVFRTLELFATLNLVERLDLPGGEHAYVQCAPQHHHHHAVCSRCGHATDVAEGPLLAAVDEVGRRSGFRIESHRLELFGICPGCQAAEPR